MNVLADHGTRPQLSLGLPLRAAAWPVGKGHNGFANCLSGRVTMQRGQGPNAAILEKGNKFMQIQVNSNRSMAIGESFERWAFSRFKDVITRIEVHMSDENGDRPGLDDKRCVIEARLANRDPVAVNHQAPNQDEAFRGASDKLKRLIEHTLGKVRDHRARESIRHDLDLDQDQNLDLEKV